MEMGPHGGSDRVLSITEPLEFADAASAAFCLENGPFLSELPSTG